MQLAEARSTRNPKSDPLRRGDSAARGRKPKGIRRPRTRRTSPASPVLTDLRIALSLSPCINFIIGLLHRSSLLHRALLPGSFPTHGLMIPESGVKAVG